MAKQNTRRMKMLRSAAVKAHKKHGWAFRRRASKVRRFERKPGRVVALADGNTKVVGRTPPRGYTGNVTVQA